MPEGPSIVILKQALKSFKGKEIISSTGNSKIISPSKLKGKTIKSFKSWGKHFLICFDDFTVRIHFLMFGSYTINERKDRSPRLRITFDIGEINFYSCSVKIITEDLKDIYDWESDVMNPKWNSKKARKKIMSKQDELICDVLLDQQIFSGVGNIIKNEVLYRTKTQPESKVKNIPGSKIKLLISEAVNYSFDFLKWKKKFVLKKHWLVHTKKVCQKCDSTIIKEYLGKTNRRSFYCPHCQKKY